MIRFQHHVWFRLETYNDASLILILRPRRKYYINTY
jgi:hypothetical protein